MAIKSDAQRRAVAKYNAANYERVELRLDKGKKDSVRRYAEERGESLNGFINRAIHETMGLADRPEEALEAPTEHFAGSTVNLSEETLKVAQIAAEATGETLQQFVHRAIDTQAQRDKVTQAINHTKPQKKKEE